MPTTIYGCRTPRIRTAPIFNFTEGEDAGFLATAYGLKPDPWQQDVINVWLSTTKRGKLLVGKAGLSVPRQNGKNSVLEIVELYKITQQGRKILHTAHEVKTARMAFLRLASFFENQRQWPELAAMLVPNGIRRTNGQEAIILRNGGSIEFSARSRGAARGYTVDDLVCDEAQELTDEQLEALLPTISAAPSGDPQQIYTGTPPGERSPGEVFPRLRKQGVAGHKRRFSWHEWSVPDDMPAAQVLAKWQDYASATNPALGIRLNLTTVEDERGTMSPEGFCRERCGKWDQVSSAAAGLPLDRWDAAVVAKAPEKGRKVFAVQFAWDGSGVALGAARRPPNGPIHVEGIKQTPMGDGTGWLADWLVARHREAAQIVIHGRGQAEALVNTLRDRGIRSKKLMVIPGMSDVVAAHAMFENAVVADQVTHPADDALHQQVKNLIKQPIGTSGGFGWASRTSEPVLMIEALTFAHWGARTTKRYPNRRSRGGVMT